MEARYFRYLFENVPDGIIQWGFVNDTWFGEKVYYIYLAENTLRRINVHTQRATQEALRHLPQEEIDILVLGEFKVFYVVAMLEILKTRRVKSVVLPYIVPAYRQMLAESLPFPENVKNFILRPYSTLLRMGVEEIHYLYGNGKNITSNPDGFPEGVYFEQADEEALDQIEHIEGVHVELEKAGYIVKCDWLFYFGLYGPDVEEMKELATHSEEGIDVMPIQTTITMFAGPLHDGPSYVDSVFTDKTFTRDLACARTTEMEKNWCDMRCMRYQDYSMLKQHTKSERKGSCFGILLLGNINLKQHMGELTGRYHSIGKRIRILTIPDGASFDKWNPQILAMFCGTDYHYWIAAMNRSSSGEVLKDIIFSSAYHHLVHVNAEFGSCFSGYLVDKL